MAVGVVALLLVVGVAIYLLSNSNNNNTEETPAMTNTQDTDNSADTGSQIDEPEPPQAPTGTRLPEGFPEDFPIYEGGSTFLSNRFNNKFGGYDYSVTLQYKDGVVDESTMVDFYKSEMADAGWTLSAERKVVGTTLIYSKTGYNSSLIIQEDDNENLTSVAISITQAE